MPSFVEIGPLLSEDFLILSMYFRYFGINPLSKKACSFVYLGPKCIVYHVPMTHNFGLEGLVRMTHNFYLNRRVVGEKKDRVCIPQCSVHGKYQCE